MKLLKSKLMYGMSIIALLILFNACQKDTLSSEDDINILENEMDNERILDALCSENFECRDQVSIADGRIHFSECTSIHKGDFLERLDALSNEKISEPLFTQITHPLNPQETLEVSMEDKVHYDENNNVILEDRQTILDHALGFVKNSEVGNIWYYIRPSAINAGCAGGYETAINQATTYWNNLAGIKVHFSRTYTQSYADLIFACDTDPLFSGDLSYLADLPNNAAADLVNLVTRVPAQYISINDTGSQSYKKGRMIHEIGHCLGLGHTGHNQGPFYQMYDTPQNDQYSVMNSMVNRNWMSSNDKKAVRRLWPSYLSKPSDVSFQRVGSMVRIRLRNSGISTRPYNHINVAHWYNGSFQPWGVWGHQASSTGNYDIYWIKNFPPGRHYFCISGASHNNEVWSPYTTWAYVDM